MSFSQDDVLNAVKEYNEAKLREMTAQDVPTVLAAKDESGWTALHWAAIYGHTAIAELLVETGIDVDAKGPGGNTALHCAAKGGHPAIVKLLMEAGADVDAEDEDWGTPLDRAEEYGHSEIVALLRAPPVVTAETNTMSFSQDDVQPPVVTAETTTMGFSQDDVIDAVQDGNETKLREMVSEDAPKVLAAKTENGWTALHHAAVDGHTAIAKLLVETGVDVHAKDEYGQTALHWAAIRGHTAIAELLVETGIDVHAKDESGTTALHRAAYKGHTAIVELLVEAGIDVDAKGPNGTTALHCAAMGGHTAIVKLLMEAGADVDAEDVVHAWPHGKTALALAGGHRPSGGHSEIVALLRAPPAVTAERQLFDALDLDQDGTVTHAELRKGFRGKRKDELRQLAEACGHQWQSLEGRLYDLPNTEGFSFQEFGACLSAAVEDAP